MVRPAAYLPSLAGVWAGPPCSLMASLRLARASFFSALRLALAAFFSSLYAALASDLRALY